jgi:IclR family acetate operon transcriptional repressor
MFAVAETERARGGHDGCVQSLVRAFRLLDELNGYDGGLTLTEVARLASLPRSTAHRLLTTMESVRYVAFDASTSQWMIGARARACGGAFAEPQDIGRLARPILQSIRLNTHASVSVSVLGEGDVRYVAQSRLAVERHPIPRPGDHFPLHTTAAGKIMLAQLSGAELDPFLRADRLAPGTACSITDLAAFEREIEAVRRLGYAVDDQESVTGVRCVAAAVHDRQGRVRAALSISGSILKMSDARVSSLGGTLRLAARRMTEDFGGAIAA